MDKTQISERLLRIKVLQDNLEEEVAGLRTLLEVDDLIVLPSGRVAMFNQIRSTYDEATLLKDMQERGIDPSLIGEVVISVNREKLASAIESGVMPTDLVEKNKRTQDVSVLRVTPSTSLRDEVVGGLGQVVAMSDLFKRTR